ncbi:MAG TPA: hypothetical protein VJP39_03765 [Gaiellaceae bacterium]|nr:hypothetical protein [Gaiellaceae bacterium]
MPSGAWRANAQQVVAQLRQDVASAEIVGSTEGAARAQLANESDLFGLLLAYTDLSGCRTMMQSTGAPPKEERLLMEPCASLQKASALFVRANTMDDPAALVAATREAAHASPLLVRAALVAKSR